MDSPRDADRPAVIDDDTGGADRTDRDLRDVLSQLVVSEGDRTDDSLRAIARAAGGSDRLVPELLASLDADATAVRIGAAWTLCALADDQPAAVGYLAERLAERADDDDPFEVGQVLAYLRGRYPGRVADAIDSAAARGALDADGHERKSAPRASGDDDAASPARVDAGPDRGKRIETDGGVPAGAVADLGDGRQVVRPSGRSGGVHQRPAEPERPRQPGDAPTGSTGGAPPRAGSRPPARRDSSPPPSHPTHPDYEESADGNDATASASSTSPASPSSTPSSAESPSSRSPASHSSTSPAPAGSRTDVEPATPDDTGGPPATDRRQRPETPDTFAAIGALSSFDRLSAVAEGCESRFATGYRCRAVADEDERGVAARLFDRPDESDRLEFAADLKERLARWQALGDGERVVDVIEWGDRPRPWVATQPVDESLADRDRPPVDQALWQAIQLTDAVAHCHSHGAVHAGIDPRSVVFRGDALSGLDRPMLDNVGLMHAFRSYFQPANYLDPRFAAPEYFDGEYGKVDAATDVYGLGATCYYLFTGRPPFDGSYAEVREGVLDRRPPSPSVVTDAVPEALDSVVRKAMAKEKLKRYDSVEGFRNDLEAICD
ncbi:hypothetical protein [Halosimplex amylolyticum]|uniref:hypothetical protein n=1 Tax=Halosimplex amylolyticum TaxID=3396616 RepID=UPI003F577190